MRRHISMPCCYCLSSQHWNLYYPVMPNYLFYYHYLSHSSICTLCCYWLSCQHSNLCYPVTPNHRFYYHFLSHLSSQCLAAQLNYLLNSLIKLLINVGDASGLSRNVTYMQISTLITLIKLLYSCPLVEYTYIADLVTHISMRGH